MALHETGHYSFQDHPLARDAFGILYEGIDSTSGEAVIAKEMRSPISTKRVGARGLALSKIRHPSLALARDEILLQNGRYVVIARPEGELLGDCLSTLREGGVHGRYQLLCITVEICKAAEALHRVGLVHGGINPTSIMIKRDPGIQSRLLLFEPFEPCPPAHLLKPGAELRYMAQEQLRGSGSLVSDVYALGMLLYTSFAEGVPFSGQNPYELAEQIVWGNLTPFTPYLDDLDPALAKVVTPDVETVGAVATRALQRNPLTRYTTVVEMRRPLEQIAQRLQPLVLGRTLYQDGRFKLAAIVLEEARSNPDEFLEVNVLLGRIYGHELDNYDEGVKAFKRAIRVRPSLDSARLGLAELYTRHGRHHLAKREFNALLEARPDDPQLMMGYAALLEQNGNPQGALNVFRKVQATSPYFLPAYAAAIRIGMSQENLQEAENDCTRALERITRVVKMGNLDPQEIADIYYLRGLLHQRQGRHAPAVRWLGKAVEQMPFHQQSHNLLAVLYAEEGQIDKAVEHFVSSLNADPNQTGIMEVMMRIFMGQAKQQNGASNPAGSVR